MMGIGLFVLFVAIALFAPRFATAVGVWYIALGVL